VPSSAVAKAATTYDYSVKEAMGTWQFWLLWAMLFLNVSAGIMIISQASPMAQQMVGMTAIAAASMVGLSRSSMVWDEFSGHGSPITWDGRGFTSCFS
jgi:hypothetical protein